MSQSSGKGPLRAGVIGLGHIGSGVSISLIKSGRAPIVFDIRREAAEAITGVAAVAGSAAEVAAASDVVMVAVLDAPQSRDVLLGEGGILDGASEGLVVVLLATVDVPVIRELAAAAAERGVVLLDCGVTPGQLAAENGMVAMIGGDDADVDRARPVLLDWAKAVVYCGPTGAGMVAKIARNMVTYCSWRVVYEASRLAVEGGVPVNTFLEVIKTADPAGTTLLSLSEMRDGNVGEPGSDEEQRLMRLCATYVGKDLAAADDLSRELAIDLPFLQAMLPRSFEMLGLPPAADTPRDTP